MFVLVTGGAGFIGSHITEELLKRGHEVRIIDDLSAGKIENIEHLLKEVEFMNADIRDFDKVKKAVEGVDVVCHQAAKRCVPMSMENPYEFHSVNIDGHLNILKASLESGVKRIVFASSSSVYGNCKKFPQKEDFKPDPKSPYALTKVAGEMYCKLFSDEFGLDTISLRYFNVFGPRQDPKSKYAAVIPAFIERLLKNESPVIYGDGRQSRDFTYVKDVVKANILAIESGKKFNGEIVNVSAGRSLSILELFDILKDILGKKVKPIFKPRRAGDVFKTQGCPEKAKKILGFEIKRDVKDALKETVEWFKRKL